MTLAAVWTFISLHWHKIVAVGAFAFAVYNKFMHNRLLNQLTKQVSATVTTQAAKTTSPTAAEVALNPPQLPDFKDPKKRVKHAKKHKKHKH